jgi:hypothetical protein
MTEVALDSLRIQDKNINGVHDIYEVWNYDYFSKRDKWSYEYPDELAVTDFLTFAFSNNYYSNAAFYLEGGVAQFTHNLPETKTQQYYEMIGKYHQFACGWNDFDGYVYEDGKVKMKDVYIGDDDEGQPIHVSIPELRIESNSFNYSENGYNSPQVDFYEDLRDKTNQAYETGQNFLMITLVNHVASAFDASYVIKKKYQIDSRIRIENSDKGEAIGLGNYKVTYSLAW